MSEAQYEPLEKQAYRDLMYSNLRPHELVHYVGGCLHGRLLPVPSLGILLAGDPKRGERHRYVFTGRGNVMVWDKVILESRQWAGTQESMALPVE